MNEGALHFILKRFRFHSNQIIFFKIILVIKTEFFYFHLNS